MNETFFLHYEGSKSSLLLFGSHDPDRSNATKMATRGYVQVPLGIKLVEGVSWIEKTRTCHSPPFHRVPDFFSYFLGGGSS